MMEPSSRLRACILRVIDLFEIIYRGYRKINRENRRIETSLALAARVTSDYP